jgi:hypothetical protein
VTGRPILLLWGSDSILHEQWRVIILSDDAFGPECAVSGCWHGPCHTAHDVTWVVGCLSSVSAACWVSVSLQTRQLAASLLHPQGLPLWPLQSGRRGPLPLCQVSCATHAQTCSVSGLVPAAVTHSSDVPFYCRAETPSALSSMLSTGRRSLSRMLSTRDQAAKDT